jgi:hypothetical protein
VNPLPKVRSGATGAVTKIRGGVRGGWNKASGGLRGGLRSLGQGMRDRAASISDGARDGVAAVWEHSGGARLMQSARSNPQVAIAWAALALIVFAWIAWTIYITAKHGTAAGLGVLISWPALFAALAIVSAPFVGAWLLVRRHRSNGSSPAIAGGAEVGGAEAEKFTGGTYPG